MNSMLIQIEDYIPKVDLDLYPRTGYHIPENTDKGGWASKVPLLILTFISLLIYYRLLSKVQSPSQASFKAAL